LIRRLRPDERRTGDFQEVGIIEPFFRGEISTENHKLIFIVD